MSRAGHSFFVIKELICTRRLVYLLNFALLIQTKYHNLVFCVLRVIFPVTWSTRSFQLCWDVSLFRLRVCLIKGPQTRLPLPPAGYHPRRSSKDAERIATIQVQCIRVFYILEKIRNRIRASATVRMASQALLRSRLMDGMAVTGGTMYIMYYARDGERDIIINSPQLKTQILFWDYRVHCGQVDTRLLDHWFNTRSTDAVTSSSYSNLRTLYRANISIAGN